MSPEKIAVREEHNEASKNLYECYAINNVDPRNISPSACKDEQEKMGKATEIFNRFMRKREEKVPRNRYKVFMKKYSALSEDVLKNLHEENCKTQWGSSASPECNAIAESLARKKIQRLKSKQ